MSVSGAAERYARAIFELGAEAGQLDRLIQEITEFASSFSELPVLRRALENPVLEEGLRESLLRQLARRAELSPLTVNALLVLLRRRRLGALPGIARRLRSLSDEKNGIVRAKVVSASSLPETYFSQLRQALEHLLGKRVIVEHEEDPSLIGGIVARIGDNTFDGSIQGRLEELGRKLLATG
ncbi:MAG TPA: ATP synthase F1 subunit delta [Polyangiaceae bacterium]|nr:ATP synthase F1 subunit delta [Polyangiaceae bacterium]